MIVLKILSVAGVVLAGLAAVLYLVASILEESDL